MECKWAERLIDAYHDGELEGAAAEKLERHLASCASCQMQAEAVRRLSSAAKVAPEKANPRLQGRIADRLQSRPALSRTNLIREKWMKKARWGLMTAVLTATLVIGMTFGSRTNAYAALEKMQTAVEKITSAHFRVTINGDPGEHLGQNMEIPMIGDGPLTVDAYSQDDMWRVDAMNMKMTYDGTFMKVYMGDQLMMTEEGGRGEKIENVAEEIKTELLKELKNLGNEYNAKSLGRETINGRSYEKLEVQGLEEAKDVRLLYWVEPGSGLPGRLEVYQAGTSEPMVKIDVEYNKPYPESFFRGEEPPAAKE
jgi:outer membrane lipoprotein-sorting protein